MASYHYFQALLRPGRFDRLVYVGVADGTEERRKVLSSLTRKFVFAPGFGVAGIRLFLGY